MSAKFSKSVMVVGGLAVMSSLASGQTTGTTTTTGAPVLWSNLVWAPSAPNAAGDIARLWQQATSTITLDQNVTLTRLEVGDSTANFNPNLTVNGSGTNAITFDSGVVGTSATMLLGRVSGDALARSMNADMVLNSDLVATWSRVQNREQRLGGVISGDGKLSIYYAVAPPAGNTDSGVVTGLNGTRHAVDIGTAAGAANTYKGGTHLEAGSASYTAVFFRTNKTDALGTGVLDLNSAAVNFGIFDQTVGGLSGGTNSSKIGTLSGTAGTTTLTLKLADATDVSFSGQLLKVTSTEYTVVGANTGRHLATDTLARDFSLTVDKATGSAGTGVQTLTGSNTYTGATTINGGTLLVNGSVTASAVTANAGVLGGNATFGNSVLINTNATIATGGTVASAIGNMTISGGLDVQGAMRVDVDDANLSDLYSVAGGLALGSASSLNVNILNAIGGTTYLFGRYGTLTGQFSSVTSGWTVDYAYDDGISTNNLALIAVPEPGAVAFGLLGGALLFVRRKRTA